MGITDIDAIVLADVRDGKKPRLSLRTARMLRDKLDNLIQELSAKNDNVNHRLHNMMPQSSYRKNVIEGGGPCRDAVAGEATCEHSCACHEFVMNPRIWSNLPKELLHLVFGRLPPHEMVRLCWLFKEWKPRSSSRVATTTVDEEDFFDAFLAVSSGEQCVLAHVSWTPLCVEYFQCQSLVKALPVKFCQLSVCTRRPSFTHKVRKSYGT